MEISSLIGNCCGTKIHTSIAYSHRIDIQMQMDSMNVHMYAVLVGKTIEWEILLYNEYLAQWEWNFA